MIRNLPSLYEENTAGDEGGGGGGDERERNVTEPRDWSRIAIARGFHHLVPVPVLPVRLKPRGAGAGPSFAALHTFSTECELVAWTQYEELRLLWAPLKELPLPRDVPLEGGVYA
jgi:hypothetical protein